MIYDRLKYAPDSVCAFKEYQFARSAEEIETGFLSAAQFRVNHAAGRVADELCLARIFSSPAKPETGSNVTFHVGWRDIWFGEQMTPSACPIWRALHRSGHGYFVVRSHDLCQFDNPERIPLPLPVQDFITRFDFFNGPRLFRPLFFRPFTFEIALPRL
jgi:hypothetical protein